MRRALQRRQDPRLPASLHRRGSGRGRRDAGARARTTRSSPPIASTVTRWCAGPGAASIMAEMYGKAEGCSRGRGGSMHLFDVSHALLRRQCHRRRRAAARGRSGAGRQDAGAQASDRCFFGDGAVAEGEFHESLNLAALWKLPVLFCLREQPLRDGHARSSAHSRRPICALRRKLRDAGRGRSTGWTCWRSRRRPRRAVEAVRARRRAVLPRVPDLPLPRPLDVRPASSIATRRKSKSGRSAIRSPPSARGCTDAGLLSDDDLGSDRSRGRRGDRRGSRVRRGRHLGAGRGSDEVRLHPDGREHERRDGKTIRDDLSRSDRAGDPRSAAATIRACS